MKHPQIPRSLTAGSVIRLTISGVHHATTITVPCHYLYCDGMSAIKSRVVEAAIDLVGTKGLRALTHARVDERAGLPKGSTSNYFRSHQALLAGVVDGIVDRELPSVGVAFSPSTPEELVGGLCALFEHITTVNRTVTTARLVLFMEASHNAALREALSRGRASDGSLGYRRPRSPRSPRTTHGRGRHRRLLRGAPAPPDRPAGPH